MDDRVIGREDGWGLSGDEGSQLSRLARRVGPEERWSQMGRKLACRFSKLTPKLNLDPHRLGMQTKRVGSPSFLLGLPVFEKLHQV